MARGVWNAGFSRHSPPQAGGGANLITRAGAQHPHRHLRPGLLPPVAQPRQRDRPVRGVVDWTITDAPHRRL